MEQKNNDHQTINSRNNFNVPSKTRKHRKNYKGKYKLDPSLTNKYSAWVSNPTVQPDNETEMGVPIPDEINTEFSKEYGEESKL
ncbi:MAG: hypothetical protein LIO62_08260 [Clostridiales bacterium]|nr:hypothetical protein [Clostridiales bacterium]